MEHTSFCKLSTFYKQNYLKTKERSDPRTYLENLSKDKELRLCYSIFIDQEPMCDLLLDYFFLQKTKTIPVR